MKRAYGCILVGLLLGLAGSAYWLLSQPKKIPQRLLPAGEPSALVVVWSPDMPLSPPALTNLLQVGDAVGIPLLIYLDPYSDLNFAALVAKNQGLAAHVLTPINGELYEILGGTVQTPALFVIRERQVVGTPILGFNTLAQYQELIIDRLQKSAKKLTYERSDIKKCGSNSYAVTDKSYIPVEKSGSFLQPYRLKKEILYANGLTSYILGDEIVEGPALIDPMPTVDEKLVHALDAKTRIIHIYISEEYLAQKRQAKPIFSEKSFYGTTYQTMAPLAGRDNRYRIIARTPKGLFFRDYHYLEKSKEITPLGAARRLCAKLAPMNTELSLPMIAKDGQRFVARSERLGLSVLYRIDSDSGECASEGILPFAGMGKGSFNLSGTLLAFQRDHSAFVYDIEKNHLWEIPPATPYHSQTLPAFKNERELVIQSRIQRDGSAAGKRDSSEVLTVTLKDCL